MEQEPKSGKVILLRARDRKKGGERERERQERKRDVEREHRNEKHELHRETQRREEMMILGPAYFCDI